MPSEQSDAELVAALVGGQSSALATIYDRYSGSLYDTARAMLRDPDDAADVTQDVFIVAADRIGQLRDPDRLKPWLFAILRNEVYRRTKKRSRTSATDFREGEAESMLPSTPSDDGAQLEYQELAALVRDAAGGLDERDQFVLELSVRQGLAGADLADALGVSAQESYNLVHRMRQRVERSLGALLVARNGRKDCDELGKILATWDGTFSVLIRKRVARHIEQCEICERTRVAAAPLSLVAGAPAFAVPDGLRERVLAAAGRGPAEVPYAFEAEGGFPVIVRAGRRLAVLFGIGAAVLLLGGAGVAWSLTDDAQQLGAPTTTAASASPFGDESADGASDEPSESAADGEVSAAATVTTTSGPVSTTETTSTTAATTTTIPVLGLPPSTTTTIPVLGLPTPTTIAVLGLPTTTIAPTANPTVVTTTTVPPAPPPPPPPPPPGALSLSASSIDFGTTGTSEVLTLSNPGGQPVAWSVGLGPVGFAAGPFTVSPAGGSIAPGGQERVVVSFDRAGAPEGSRTGSATFSAAGINASVQLRASVARPPQLQVLAAPPAEMCVRTTNALTWRLSVVDETEPITARVTVTTPSRTTITAAATRLSGDLWSAIATLAPAPTPSLAGFYQWTVVATDGLGVTSAASGSTTIITRC